ncbi:MAG: hypothetical protein V7L04_32575 [Nostoc sp.]|uniref:hypothetical protein n=1 Tax=Nostoc sp. TaxID=1180 RepID=UPI002FFA3756
MEMVKLNCCNRGITHRNNGTDKISLTSELSFGQLTISSSGSDTLINLNGTTLATLTGINSSLITSADFVTI